MEPNGVIHSHAIKLITYDKGDPKCPQQELYFVPDKAFHEIRKIIRTMAKEE